MENQDRHSVSRHGSKMVKTVNKPKKKQVKVTFEDVATSNETSNTVNKKKNASIDEINACNDPKNTASSKRLTRSEKNRCEDRSLNATTTGIASKENTTKTLNDNKTKVASAQKTNKPTKLQNPGVVKENVIAENNNSSKKQQRKKKNANKVPVGLLPCNEKPNEETQLKNNKKKKACKTQELPKTDLEMFIEEMRLAEKNFGERKYYSFDVSAQNRKKCMESDSIIYRLKKLAIKTNGFSGCKTNYIEDMILGLQNVTENDFASDWDCELSWVAVRHFTYLMETLLYMKTEWEYFSHCYEVPVKYIERRLQYHLKKLFIQNIVSELKDEDDLEINIILLSENLCLRFQSVAKKFRMSYDLLKQRFDVSFGWAFISVDSEVTNLLTDFANEDAVKCIEILEYINDSKAFDDVKPFIMNKGQNVKASTCTAAPATCSRDVAANYDEPETSIVEAFKGFNIENASTQKNTMSSTYTYTPEHNDVRIKVNKDSADTKNTKGVLTIDIDIQQNTISSAYTNAPENNYIQIKRDKDSGSVKISKSFHILSDIVLKTGKEPRYSEATSINNNTGNKTDVQSTDINNKIGDHDITYSTKSTEQSTDTYDVDMKDIENLNKDWRKMISTLGDIQWNNTFKGTSTVEIPRTD